MKKKVLLILSSAIAASGCMGGALNAFAAEEEPAVADAASGGLFTFVLPLLIMFALLYFIAIRPQKKQEKEAKEMQDSLKVGDEIVTNGGIIGMVIRIGEDNVVIETGGDRNKIRIKKWAIAENVTGAERARKEQAKSKSPLETASVSGGEGESKKKKQKKSDEE